MFTGIIEEKGKILSITRSKIQKIEVASGLEVKKGDSVALQGICLTVIDMHKSGFMVEVMQQTRGKTTLAEWRAGQYVNLERALRMGDRLGGHIMLGHVDEVSKLVRIKGNEYFFQTSPENITYIVPKGSIGIDGASLTISQIRGNVFSVSLIPYTLNYTTLGSLRAGARVNIEYDYLAKLFKRK